MNYLSKWRNARKRLGRVPESEARADRLERKPKQSVEENAIISNNSQINYSKLNDHRP